MRKGGAAEATRGQQFLLSGTDPWTVLVSLVLRNLRLYVTAQSAKDPPRNLPAEFRRGTVGALAGEDEGGISLMEANRMLRACRRIIYRAVAGLCFLVHVQALHGSVPAGWELLETLSGTQAWSYQTTLLGESWRGVPLGTFDFGPAYGVRSVGTADTIIRRDPVACGEDECSPEYSTLVVEAMQWVSVSPFDAGSGLDYHYLTLQSARAVPGPASTGHIAEYPGEDGPLCDHGLSLAFDIRIGSLDGEIVQSGTASLIMMDWPYDGPPAGALVLPGINDGFWLQADAHYGYGDMWAHRYAIPEPGAAALLAALALAGWNGTRRTTRRGNGGQP
ncbi:MAG TPA: hypothetical protein PK640_08025 [Verrucomicrobiota bacterium]|nr:hypothetical protein [Verrucomicrobiota bacterium]